jgi:uncharacterized protein with FMN-binding domain
MRRTFGLVGLLVLGITLLFNPTAGLFAPYQETVVATDTAATVVTTGEPPPDNTVAAGAETTTSTTGSLVVTGPSVSTRFGSFQVEVTIESGRLVSATTLRQPSDRRSQSINSRALPAYEAAAINAQSADFDALSGATITWQAYTTSLQAALDEAGM